MPRRRDREPGFVRIIGGQWRRQRLPVPPVAGLRPTADRVRETLFNWLQTDMHGAHCLDLFAGSGALGFEAASRGAAKVVLIDTDGEVVSALRASAQHLAAAQIQIIQADAMQWLARPQAQFDIVFVDPPFASEIQENACAALAVGGWLTPRGRVYLEYPAGLAVTMPADWQITHQQRAGRVGFALAQRSDKQGNS